MSDDIVMQSIDREAVLNILRLGLPSTAKVWVFGSRANGTTKRAADLDLALDVGRKLTSDEISNLEFAFIESELPYRVDIVDMHAISGQLRENVLRDRKLLSLTKS
jgi:predicted nucleotidyltransferase